MKRIPAKTLFSFLLLLQTIAGAQTDTEFWFVAPDITNGYDSPVLMRISASDQPATITLSQPANPAFAPITAQVPANTTYSIELTPFLNQIENKPAGQVLNYGLYLKSDAPVTAYYEVNKDVNPDIFSLKGNNAKGTEFYTPFQTRYVTGGYPGPPTSAFDIVATEDNTRVTVTPSKVVFGHPAGVPFTLQLNRGQTYSCATNAGGAAGRPAGSHIVSDKPVCVTIKDDLVQNAGCADLHGDQLVPVSILGTEYIVLRGNLSSAERVYVLATQPGTEIFADGAATPAATLNAGEQFEFSINSGTRTLYIRASAPVYVLHLAGFGCEMGAALLPPILCTGSSSVFFARSTTEFFALNIMCKTGAEQHFTLNGNPALVPASAFQPVNGTNGAWQAAQISFNTGQVPAGNTSILQNNSPNDNLFHLGIINGGSSSGCRFGYFSDYSSLNLGGNRTLCSNDSARLDAGPGKSSYTWNTGDTTRFLSVYDEGTYWVTTTQAGCTFNDTVTILKDTLTIQLGNDTLLCNGQQLLLEAPDNVTAYYWQDNSTGPVYPVTESGEYSLNATTAAGCTVGDTIEVLIRPALDAPALQSNSPLCVGDTLVLQPEGEPGAIYTWTGPDSYTGSGDSLILPDVSLAFNGQWSVVQSMGGCTGPAAETVVTVEAIPQPVITGDTLVCTDEVTVLAVEEEYDVYRWSTGSEDPSTEIGPGTYSVTVYTPAGCAGSDTLTVHNASPDAAFSVEPALQVLKGTEFRFSNLSQLSPSAGDAQYSWDFGNGDGSSEQHPAYTYPDTGTYPVTLLVESGWGCTAVSEQSVKVVEGLIIPNTFSPNGDGQNDLFYIHQLEFYPGSRLEVFNRWGTSVYTSSPYLNNWDGYNLPEGTYFFLLNVDGIQEVFKGTVFIAR